MTTPFDPKTAKSLNDFIKNLKPPVTVYTPDNLNLESPYSLMLYGPAKTGKTQYAGTAGPRTLYITLDDSHKTFGSYTYTSIVGPPPNFVIPIYEKLNHAGIAENPEAYDKTCETIDWFLSNLPDQFDTVVVDGTTAFRRAAMFKGLLVSGELGKSKSLGTIKKHDMMVTAVQDYGAEMSLIEQFIAGYTSILNAAGKHFIMIAHERIQFKKVDGINDTPLVDKIRPGFTGRTHPDALMGYFDWVFHAETATGGNGTIYRLRTRGNESIVCGGRSGGVFNEIETNANFLEMIARARAGKKAEPISITGRK